MSLDQESGQADGDLDLDFDTLGVDTGEGEAVDASNGHEGPVEFTGRASSQFKVVHLA